MRYVRPRLILSVAVSFALLASLGTIAWQSREIAVERQQLTEAARVLDRLSQRLGRPTGSMDPPGMSETEPGCKPAGKGAGADPSVLLRSAAQVEFLQMELQSARKALGDLQSRLSTSDEERQKANARSEERFEKLQTEWRNRFEQLKNEHDAALLRSHNSRQRVDELEAANAKLKDERAEDSARSREASAALANLREVNRRRATQVAKITRRYQDVIAQFRSMNGVIDSTRDQNTGVLSNAALTRIQNTISLAEEDIRELNDLNTQADQLERKLTAK